MMGLHSVVARSFVVCVDPVAATAALQETMNIRTTRDGMEVSWGTSMVPDHSEVMFLWHINSPPSSLTVVAKNNTGSERGRIVDPGGNPSSGNRVMLFYGGFNTESLSETVTSFGTAQKVMMVQWSAAKTDESVNPGTWGWALGVMVTAIVVGILCRGRRADPHGRTSHPGTYEDASWLAERRRSHGF